MFQLSPMLLLVSSSILSSKLFYRPKNVHCLMLKYITSSSLSGGLGKGGGGGLGGGASCCNVLFKSMAT